MRYAIIKNDLVVNVIVADSKFVKESKINAIECPENVCVGWSYLEEEFIAPEIIFDETISE